MAYIVKDYFSYRIGSLRGRLDIPLEALLLFKTALLPKRGGCFSPSLYYLGLR